MNQTQICLQQLTAEQLGSHNGGASVPGTAVRKRVALW